MKNAGKACNNRLYRHIRTFEKIVKNYFVILHKITYKFEFLEDEFRNFASHVFVKQFHLCSVVGTISLVRWNTEINIFSLDVFAQFLFLQCVQNIVGGHIQSSIISRL